MTSKNSTILLSIIGALTMAYYVSSAGVAYSDYLRELSEEVLKYKRKVYTNRPRAPWRLSPCYRICIYVCLSITRFTSPDVVAGGCARDPGDVILFNLAIFALASNNNTTAFGCILPRRPS